MRWAERFASYRMEDFRKDAVAGFIVGIIAIPLGMAFAIAAGVKPEYGIYTTIVAGILISLLGGSRFQIGGPTGAFIPILFAVVSQYGYENLLIAGFLAGILLVVMGLCRLGALIAYIPKPVTVGFTAGIAVIIFSGQIANFLGLTGVEKHESFIANMKEIGYHLHTINAASVFIASLCLAGMLLIPRRFPRIPGSVAGLTISTVVAAAFFEGEVATIASSFGAIPRTLPTFQWPELTWDRITLMIQPALLIAALGGIESLLSAVVADKMSGTKHNSNRELIGQGIANMAAPLFGGIPATGAIARTAANIKSGARSPLAGVLHGVVVLLVLLLFAPLASRIPLASIAPILMMVAWNMSERHVFHSLLRARTSDSIVLVVTFLLTVFTNLVTAVEAGLAIAVLLFVKRMSDVLAVSQVLPNQSRRHGKLEVYQNSEGKDCPQIKIHTIEGPLFFGASGMFEQLLAAQHRWEDRTMILVMKKVPFIDTTGEDQLARFIRHVQIQGGRVLIAGLQPQPKRLLEKTGLESLIGKDAIFDSTGEALDEALLSLHADQCVGCPKRLFRECSALSRGHGIERTAQA